MVEPRCQRGDSPASPTLRRVWEGESAMTPHALAPALALTVCLPLVALSRSCSLGRLTLKLLQEQMDGLERLNTQRRQGTHTNLQTHCSLPHPPPTYTLPHSPTCSLPHSPTCSLPHPPTCSLPHSSTPHLPLPHLLTDSLTPSLPHLLTHSLPYLLTCSLPHPPTCSLPHSSTSHLLTPSPAH